MGRERLRKTCHRSVGRSSRSCTVKLEGTAPARVIACDEHGYPRGTKVATSGSLDALQIKLDPVSVYHVLVR